MRVELSMVREPSTFVKFIAIVTSPPAAICPPRSPPFDQALQAVAVLEGRSKPSPPIRYKIEFSTRKPSVAVIFNSALPPLLVGMYAVYGPGLDVSAYPSGPIMEILLLSVTLK
ncbi:MAG: hypothetical protein KAS67_01510 [Thermoplasmata archaeon]|nr:hypothetical protein [Thermoplasmata archaeon]